MNRQRIQSPRTVVSAAFLGGLAAILSTPGCSEHSGPNDEAQLSNTGQALRVETLLIAEGDFVAGKEVTQLGSFPIVSNNGTVVVAAQLDDGPWSLITPTAILATAPNAELGYTEIVSTTPRINGLGTVAFAAQSDAIIPDIWPEFHESGIFTPATRLAWTGDVLGGRTLTTVGADPDINDSGEVIFTGSFVGGTGSGVFTPTGLQGGPPGMVVGPGDVRSGKVLSTVGLARISANSEVAYFAWFNEGGTTKEGVFTNASGLLAQTGDVFGDYTLGSLWRPRISDQGFVVFGANFTDGAGQPGSGFFTSAGPLVTSSDIAGKTGFDLQIVLTSEDVTSSGDVVFLATDSEFANTAIFVGDEPLVKSGDTVAGKLIGAPWYPGVNETGDVVFTAPFEGKHGVFLLSETPLNHAPLPVDDVAQTVAGVAVSIAVLDNDSDPDGNALTLDSVDDPAHGTATITGDTITYTPDAGFTGVDSFVYVVGDGEGAVNSATVTVTVNTPAQGTGDILEEIADLVESGELDAGNGNALSQKLQNALAAIADGNTRAACGKLNAFIHQVETLIDDGTLSETQGQEFIDAAESIRTSLGC